MVLLHCCCCCYCSASLVLAAVLHWGCVLPIRKMGGPVKPPETTASSQSTAHPAETVPAVHTRQTHFKPPLSVSQVLLGQQTSPSSYKIKSSRVSSQSALSAASYRYAPIILKLGIRGRANTSGSHQFLWHHCIRAVWTRSDSPSEAAWGTGARNVTSPDTYGATQYSGKILGITS